MINQKHPDIVINRFGAKVLQKFTSSYRIFIEEATNLDLILIFILSAEHKNKTKIKNDLLTNVLEEKEPNAASNAFNMYLISEKSDEIFKAENYEVFFGQMAYSRIVDNALCYLKDILSEVVKREPKTLKSLKEQKTHDFILSFSTIEELIKAISDKKIKELFYKGVDDIKKFFKSHLNVDIFENEQDEKDFSMIVKQRNIIVHNRGIISQELTDEFPFYKEKVGNKMIFGYRDISVANKIINNLIVDLDIKLREKYALPIYDV